MKTIKIVIKGSSGYGPVDRAYEDKLTICSDSIRYDYKPVIESDDNPSRKWSYKTTSPVFQKLFRGICVAVERILDMEDEWEALDAGFMEFTVTYEDKTKRKRGFFLTVSDFEECFS